MYPNFKDKEYILTNLIDLKIEQPKRGDVIVFKAPTDKDKDFIKRVSGVPGDKVSLKDGFVYINDSKISESTYLASDVRTYGGDFLNEGEPVTVPDGNYIVLGDNRPFSSDSKEYGFVEEKYIIGKVLFCYWNCTAKH
jgi:signal peptidase I